MTDLQLFLSAWIPTSVILAGMVVNIGYFVAIIARLDAWETRLAGISRKEE